MKKFILLLFVFLGCVTFSNAQWQQTNLPNYPVQEMTVKDNLLFAATWDTGLFVTSDNGNTWVEANAGLSQLHVEAFAVCGSKIFAGGVGLFESSDNGQQWVLNSNGIPTNVNIHSFAVNGMTILAGSLNCIYRSLDGGSSWSEITNGLPYNDWVGSLVIKDSLVFAGTYDNGVFVSDDNGSSWSPVNNGFPAYIDVLALATVDGRLFATSYGQGTYMSPDDGNNWVLVNQQDSSFWGFASFAVQGNNLFLGSMNGSGILMTSDYGNTWTSVNSGITVDSIPVMSLCVHNDTLFAGLLDAGVWKRALSEMGAGCSSEFTLFPDTAIEHHYYITNIADGVLPLTYSWSWGDGSYDSTAYPSHIYDTAGFYTICLTITDAVGCSSTYCDSSFLLKSTNTMITVDVIPSTVGITENSAAQEILIFPNPVDEEINIQSNQTFGSIEQIRIIDMLGRERYFSDKAVTTISTSFLEQGIYFVEVKEKDQPPAVLKFIVSR